MNETLPQAVAAAVRRDPTTPLLTWYDDATGDRAELSGATLDNWVSKTANLLIDGAGLAHGDTVAVLMPPHWQTAAVILGASAAGLVVDLGGSPGPVDALFTTPDRNSGWSSPERYVTGLLPLAMPLREVPPGWVDYPTEVRAHGDHFRPVQPVEPDDEAIAGLTHRAVIRTSAQRAGELGIGYGDRVLIDTRNHPDPMDWLFAPLVAGASIVLCANPDPAKVTDHSSAEQVTVVVA
ncbi:MAG TPA: TIGR03089 family protein [Actinoplanes sp.]|nr:TIGR03089 family protein [Actinoplanes sp.]